MGYFDALGSSSFKTMPDGRRLFFPWGVLGRGYAIPSEAHYEHLRRQVKIYLMVSMVVIIALSVAQRYLLSGIVAAFLMAGYAAWAYAQMRSLEPTDERLSYRESLTTQAVHHNKVVLWVLEVIAILYVATGLIILAVDPGNWLVALGAIVFFGACAVIFARMLILRKRAA
ncbi:MAG: hypothetical protein R3D62_16445 [Xanthobacteraceae bacterium]